LIRSLAADFAALGAIWLQCIIPHDDLQSLSRLQASGFQPLADLGYLVAHADEFADQPPRTPFTWETCPKQRWDDLADVLARTYQGTLDCPALDGQRTAADILEGYAATGVFRPEYWLLAQHENLPVGCLLLADQPQADQLELVYMGLIPQARGRHWGTWLVRQAQWLTRKAGRRRLVVAVDLMNVPAVKLYRAEGFVQWDAKKALGKAVRTAV
jgi:ribosomal protein S18 acetylase RimI-like enzyme